MLILDGEYMDIFIGTFTYFFSMSFSEKKKKKKEWKEKLEIINLSSVVALLPKSILLYTI